MNEKKDFDAIEKTSFWLVFFVLEIAPKKCSEALGVAPKKAARFDVL